MNTINNLRSTTASIDATLTTSTPPVFKGFEVLPENPNGFFIKNPKDNSIFKWIDVTKLEENGKFYGEETLHKGGRRNFHGDIFDCFKKWSNYELGYYETNDEVFKECIKNFGGFYVAICIARTDRNGKISFSIGANDPEPISQKEAHQEGMEYAIKFATDDEFSSFIPCGAAMDCIYEETFERFLKEVELIRKDGELLYDAWNRYEREHRKEFHINGIYGVYDLISGGEYTTEFYNNPYQICYRGNHAHGLYLIADNHRQKVRLSASFPAGHRNFMAASIHDCGYRIILLPKKK